MKIKEAGAWEFLSVRFFFACIFSGLKKCGMQGKMPLLKNIWFEECYVMGTSADYSNKISIILPVFNEAGIIENVIRGFYIKVVQKMPGAKLIIAEDGSMDGTKEKLRTLNKEIPFTLISADERKGYTNAFKDALRAAQTDLIFFSDSDGQHDPADVFTLLAELEGNDIVSGYKHRRCDPFYRLIISKGYNFLINFLFGLKMNDINSGFKLIRKKVIDTVLEDVAVLEYCVMSEFILRAHLRGYKIKEVPVSHYPRKTGSSIFSVLNLPRIIIGLVRGLFKIKTAHHKTKRT